MWLNIVSKMIDTSKCTAHASPRRRVQIVIMWIVELKNLLPLVQTPESWCREHAGFALPLSKTQQGQTVLNTEINR